MIGATEKYFNIKECPICGKDLRDKGLISYDRYCTNKCYRIQGYEQIDSYDFNYYIYIFGEYVSKITSGEEEIEFGDFIDVRIEYWKEDDRYLAKIMEGI